MTSFLNMGFTSAGKLKMIYESLIKLELFNVWRLRQTPIKQHITSVYTQLPAKDKHGMFASVSDIRAANIETAEVTATACIPGKL